MSSVVLHPLSNYSFSSQDSIELPTSSSISGLFLVHEHHVPHVLLLKSSTGFSLPSANLPSTHVKEALNKGLAKLMTGKDEIDWKIGERVSKWIRGTKEMPLLPYLPAHITTPAEVHETFLVHLPSKLVLSVPKNLKVIAVPIFELYKQEARYGDLISGLPVCLSRLNIVYQ